MNFVDLLQELMRGLHMSGDRPAPDARTMEIALKDGAIVTLSLLQGDKRCALTSLICFYPAAENARVLFERLLEANAFGFQTNGATFAVDRETSKVFLFKTFDLASIDARAMSDELSAFAQTAKAWRTTVDSGQLYRAEAPQAPAFASDAAGAMIFR
jgi:hypothetical protein